MLSLSSSFTTIILYLMIALMLILMRKRVTRQFHSLFMQLAGKGSKDSPATPSYFFNTLAIVFLMLLLVFSVRFLVMPGSPSSFSSESSTVKISHNGVDRNILKGMDTENPFFDYRAYRARENIQIEAYRKYLESLPPPKGNLSSSFYCLGNPGNYHYSDRRGCIFHNICYRQKTGQFEYYHYPGDIPVFMDKNLGPIYSFRDRENSNNFIQFSSNKFVVRELAIWSPLLVNHSYMPEPSNKPDHNNETVLFVKGFSSLFTYLFDQMNLGHIVYEDFGGIYYARRRFGRDKAWQRPRLFSLRHLPWHDYTFRRFAQAFFPLLTNEPVETLDTFQSFKEEQETEVKHLICFEELLVGGYSRMFYRHDDNFNEGKEPLLYEYRNEALRLQGINPYYIPKGERIVFFKKIGSRTILNIDSVFNYTRDYFASRGEEAKSPSVELIIPGTLTFREQMQLLSNTTILITPCGGISMSSPFLAHGSVAIIMDYYADGQSDYDGYLPGQSGSMEVSFWNLWPHFEKIYYQVFNETEHEGHPTRDSHLTVDPVRLVELVELALDRRSVRRQNYVPFF